jgi:RNA recognition motif-containing protein
MMTGPQRTLDNLFAGFLIPGNTNHPRNGKCHGSAPVLKATNPPRGGGLKMNKKIYIANLSFETNELDIKTHFSKAGDVSSVKIVRDRQNVKENSFAFVEMSTQWEARRAISMFNKTELKGNTLMVKEARIRRGFGGR